jgi:hypothetical protein
MVGPDGEETHRLPAVGGGRTRRVASKARAAASLMDCLAYTPGLAHRGDHALWATSHYAIRLSAVPSGGHRQHERASDAGHDVGY